MEFIILVLWIAIYTVKIKCSFKYSNTLETLH